MMEPTITCPKCKIEIRLTYSLAAPLIEATRQQFEQKLSLKDEEIAQRERAIRYKEKLILEAERALEQQVTDQVPEIDDLNLAAAEVEWEERGVRVNEFLQSESNPAVYAAGDAAASGGPPLSPVEAAQHQRRHQQLAKGASA